MLPILVGLAVDYAVQFQARVAEADLSAPGAGRAAVTIATARGAPTLATAALATAVAFLALELSPVPMVQGFGVLLVVGVAVALACALTAGAAVLAMSIGGMRTAPNAGWVAAASASLRGASELAVAPLRWLAGLLGPSVRGAGQLLRDAGGALRVRVVRGRCRGAR